MTNGAPEHSTATSPLARRDPTGRPSTHPDIVFVRRLIIGLLIIGTVVTMWMLADLLLLLFGAILIAVLLRTIAGALRAYLPIREGVRIAVAALLVIAVVGAALWLFGARIAEQIQALFELLPQAAAQVAASARLEPWLEALKPGQAAPGIGSVITKVLSWSTTLIGVVASLVLVLFGAAYLAINPEVYRDGFLKLVPPSVTPNARAALEDCEQALRQWLGAQLIAMAAVGVLVAAGLLFLGVPSALALGLIAAIAEFIPYVGPIIAAVPALIIAASQDWQLAGWTLVIYIAVQQIENAILVPFLASRTVAIPPALALFGIVAMGILFGPLGLLFGFPLLVVVFAIVRRLYLADTLGEPVAPVVEGNGQQGET